MFDNPCNNPGDTDHLSCPSCKSIMNLYGQDDNGDFRYGEGYWEYLNCGFEITEDEL